MQALTPLQTLDGKILSTSRQVTVHVTKKSREDPCYDPGQDLSPPKATERPCGETKCGRFVVADPLPTSFVVKESPLDGLGVFSRERVSVRKGQVIIGSFGGIVECGTCIHKFKSNSNDFDFRVIQCGIEHKENNGDTFWHLRRSGNADVDGPMWYLNEARATNPEGMRSFHARMENLGIDQDGFPLVQVKLVNALQGMEEVLIKYDR